MAPLWKRTTFHIGGPADLLVFPETEADVARWLRSGDVSLILGGGSNLLVSDTGVRGVTLSLGPAFGDVKIEKKEGSVIVTAGASVTMTRLAGILMKSSVTGLEFAYGIPGMLGGALVMNAGAKDGEMKDVVDSVRVVTAEGARVEIRRDEIGFGYRSSSFPEGCVITGAVLRLREGRREEINEKMRRNQLARKTTQPLNLPSAGSVYKNPAEDFAGRLIDAAGLKGASVGDAKVSEKHANFIVNAGRATAADVMELMRLVEQRVFESSGTMLDREVRLAGDFKE